MSVGADDEEAGVAEVVRPPVAEGIAPDSGVATSTAELQTLNPAPAPRTRIAGAARSSLAPREPRSRFAFTTGGVTPRRLFSTFECRHARAEHYSERHT